MRTKSAKRLVAKSTLLFSLTVLSINTPPLIAAPPAFEDPRYKFKLTVGDQTAEILEGKSTPITIGEKTKTVTINRTGLRTLSLGDLSFDYPADLDFDYGNEADYVPRGPTWFLNGVNVNLWITRIQEDRDKALKIAIREETKDLGKNNIKWSEETRVIALNKEKYNATLIGAKSRPYGEKPMIVMVFEVQLADRTYIVHLDGDMESSNRYGKAFLQMLDLMNATLTTAASKK